MLKVNGDLGMGVYGWEEEAWVAACSTAIYGS